ncbi:MAG: cell division protein FtsA [Fimbriimonadales bacterium]
MKPVFALDLGSTKVACLAAEADDNGGLRVLGAASVPCQAMRRGILSDAEDLGRAISDAVRQAEEASNTRAEELVVGLSGVNVEGTSAQGFVPIYPRSRPITREDVLQVINHSRQIVLPPDRELIMSMPREFRVDGQRGIAKPIGMVGSKLEVVTFIVNATTAYIESIEKVIHRTGKEVSEMVFQPLAAGMGVLRPQDMELGCVVADIGGGMTNVAVFSNGSLAYGASVPVGSWHITSDISKLLKTSIEEAERLKVESGGATSRIAKDDESVQVCNSGRRISAPCSAKCFARSWRAASRRSRASFASRSSAVAFRACCLAAWC